jgi:hypothetical protein
MAITILDNEYCTIWCYPEDKIIHHMIKKVVFGEHYRQLLGKGADAYIEYGCRKYLSDDRANSAIHPEDRDWSNTNFAPRVVAAGWTHWALVMPKRVIGQINMKNVIDESRKVGVEVKVFSDPDEALVWLKAQ